MPSKGRRMNVEITGEPRRLWMGESTGLGQAALVQVRPRPPLQRLVLSQSDKWEICSWEGRAAALVNTD